MGANMRIKIFVLGLISLLMVSSVLSAEKKRTITWQKFFTEPVESVYFVMKDSQIFKDTNYYDTVIYMKIEKLEERLKTLERNYKIEDIAIVIHNHRKKKYFTTEDRRQYEVLKKHGFNGLFLLYCHRTNKTYDIEENKKLK